MRRAVRTAFSAGRTCCHRFAFLPDTRPMMFASDDPSRRHCRSPTVSRACKAMMGFEQGSVALNPDQLSLLRFGSVVFRILHSRGSRPIDAREWSGDGGGGLLVPQPGPNFLRWKKSGRILRPWLVLRPALGSALAIDRPMADQHADTLIRDGPHIVVFGPSPFENRGFPFGPGPRLVIISWQVFVRRRALPVRRTWTTSVFENVGSVSLSPAPRWRNSRTLSRPRFHRKSIEMVQSTVCPPKSAAGVTKTTTPQEPDLSVPKRPRR